MIVRIRIPRLTTLGSSQRTRTRKPTPGNKAARGKQARVGRSGTTTERVLLSLFLALPLITLVQTLLARTPSGYAETRQSSYETVISGPQFSYVVPFSVTNKNDIERLIACESGGRNISELDSDGIISDGVLQFHRGPSDTLSSSTWEDFSRESGLTGSPRNPVEAIRMADWAISHGFGPRWTCWRSQKLSAGY